MTTAFDISGAFYDAHNREMKVYLAGPMRGKPFHNISQFLLGEEWLKAQGFEVLSPARKDLEAGFDFTKSLEEQPEFSMHAAFTWDFDAILRADGIVLLDGWDDSRGATAERCVAYLCGKLEFRLSINPMRNPDPIYFRDDTGNWVPDTVKERGQPKAVSRGCVIF